VDHANSTAVKTRIVSLVFLLATVTAAAAGDDTTRTSSIFAPVSAPADAVRTIATLVLAITAAIAVIVGGSSPTASCGSGSDRSWAPGYRFGGRCASRGPRGRAGR
jgi:hypothetical protein